LIHFYKRDWSLQILEMENSVYSLKDIKQINEEEFEAVFEIDDNGLPSGLCESDIHALEILKNKNLLVLGTEALEINKEVQDIFEVKDGEDLQDLSTSFTKFQDAVELYTKGICSGEQKSASASPEEIQSELVRSPKITKRLQRNSERRKSKKNYRVRCSTPLPQETEEEVGNAISVEDHQSFDTKTAWEEKTKLGDMEEQTISDSLADVDGDQRDTDKNEHLNSIVHEILDSMEFAFDDRKPDEVEKENENDNLVTLITGAATPSTKPGQEIESKLDEDNEKAFLEKCEPSKSPELQYLEKDVSDDTDKMTESHQLEILESVRGNIEMPILQSGTLEKEMSNFEENNINLSEQVENYETYSAEIIEDKSAVGNCRKLEISTEIRAGSKTSILENPILQFSLFIVAVFIFYLTFLDFDEEVSNNDPKLQTPLKLVRASPHDVIQGFVELSHLSEVTMRK